MSTDEKIKAIRTELKQLGFNNRQISVKKSYLTYETAINIIFKFMPSDELFEKVKSIARKHKEVSYCEVSGELLMGGNTFVDVSIDWKVKEV